MYGIDESEYDIERLRSDLADEFGAAAYSGFPVAMVDVFDLDKALSMGYDLDKYKKDRYIK